MGAGTIIDVERAGRPMRAEARHEREDQFSSVSEHIYMDPRLQVSTHILAQLLRAGACTLCSQRKASNRAVLNGCLTLPNESLLQSY